MRMVMGLGVLMGLVLSLLGAAPAHARVLSAYGGGGYGSYYSPSGGYISYGGPGGGVDAPTRGAWQARLQRAVNDSRVVRAAPCGAYGRAPLACRLVTTRYQPMVHGE